MLNNSGKNIKILILTFLIVFAISCANIVTPSGGPKDVTPPVAKSIEPPNLSTSFKERSVKIIFNEYVVLTDQTNQIIVSPPTAEEFNINVHGKKLILDLPEILKDSTTYTVYFGESVRDITEGNILYGFQYAFSTGSFIDSLSIRGQLTDAYKLSPVKGALVMAYFNSNDSTPILFKPDYLTKTDAQGNFVLDNVKKAKYKIFALIDLDNNMLYNLPNESLAFCDSLVTPQYVSRFPELADQKIDSTAIYDTIKSSVDSIRNDEVIHSLNLRMFVQADTLQHLLKARSDNYGQFRLYFKQPVVDVNIQLLDRAITGNWKLDEWSKNRDTLTSWLIDPEMDTLKFIVSDKSGLNDTVELTMKPKPQGKVKGKPSGKGTAESGIDLKLSVLSNLIPNQPLPYFLPLQLHLSRPIDSTDWGKISLSQKADSIIIPLEFRISSIDTVLKRHYQLIYEWQPKKIYQLMIFPGAFTDIYGKSNDTVKMEFSVNTSEDYGRLIFTFTTAQFEYPYIIQLLNDGKNVVSEKIVDKEDKIFFENLIPGNYSIRIIGDVNYDGKWTSGNYFKKSQPEPLFYFPNPISIRANWDSDFDYTH